MESRKSCAHVAATAGLGVTAAAGYGMRERTYEFQMWARLPGEILSQAASATLDLALPVGLVQVSSLIRTREWSE
jgi:hypothetical protein